jgi:hypothetical protein
MGGRAGRVACDSRHAAQRRGSFLVQYRTRYVDQIKPLDTDVGPVVDLTADDTLNNKSLGKALRKCRILMSGGRIRGFRVENDGRKIVAFPSVPGMSTYWYAIVLEQLS